MWGHGERGEKFAGRGHAAVATWAGKRLLRVAKEVQQVPNQISSLVKSLLVELKKYDTVSVFGRIQRIFEKQKLSAQLEGMKPLSLHVSRGHRVCLA